MKDDFYTVIIKQNCPYSNNAISLLKKNKKKYKVIDYFKLSKKIQIEISNIIKQQNNNIDYLYHPKIFKNDKFIGGFDKLSKILLN
jgi:glutaredoxin